MRRLIVVASLLACMPVGRAPAAFSVSDTISFAGPTGRVRAGVTEMTQPCGVQTAPFDTNGFDGFWIALPGAGEATATMTSDAIDANVYFYDGACVLIGGTTDPVGTSMATDATPNEHGTIPAGARYAIVDVILGSDVQFIFAID